ncbi:NrfD/PsrC family molybdoenzyme membrane anchor subunit [Anaeromyxobacter sp. Fw109-5]|uniref:NrfD/PsrC family molybdoenzyme membrane anchor subunit n=1 Tax=Anaeromyxobacter sp. (strain Fw109-5) TaxID=404589 RepID=UPI0000ED7F1C|nr:NrfD/PsrC family molybdoenzyme membrane anchor subunit [Anaeromyxobacter sp. Fw109-5]ABS25071.1 Polysulphide reductase NrfD [Anaeromyxobacter sp. Fw109-5]
MDASDPLRRQQAARDGRNVDPAVGRLAGEGSAQRASPGRAAAALARLERFTAERAREEAEGPSYHGLPVLKEPVWRWMIPAYFYVGGLAGAAAVLGAAAQLAGGRDTAGLVRRCRLVAAGGAVASAGLLIADLGRPSRFLAMLRVFRPTSPMNMGTWTLSAFGALSGAAALPEAIGARGLRRPADLAGLGAGLVGLPLVGYTGVLLANTAVPVWQQTRNTLPMLFAFSGAVSAGAAMDLWPPPGAGGEMARRFGLVAKGGELALTWALHREAQVERVRHPLGRGEAGVLLRVARASLAASAVLDLLRRGSPGLRIASGVLGTLGTLAVRFGVVAAGRASARDPHATFEQQRAGRGAAEVLRKGEAPGRMPAPRGIEATGQESVEHGAFP